MIYHCGLSSRKEGKKKVHFVRLASVQRGYSSRILIGEAISVAFARLTHTHADIHLNNGRA